MLLVPSSSISLGRGRLILNLSLIAAFLVGSAEETIDGVWTVRLRSCYLDYHTPAVALACPAVEAVAAAGGAAVRGPDG